jgi:hypothetical protein
VLVSSSNKSKFLKGDLNLVIVEMDPFKVSEVFSSKDLLDEEFSLRRNVYEPKVIVFGPSQ